MFLLLDRSYEVQKNIYSRVQPQKNYPSVFVVRGYYVSADLVKTRQQ